MLGNLYVRNHDPGRLLLNGKIGFRAIKQIKALRRVFKAKPV